MCIYGLQLSLYSKMNALSLSLVSLTGDAKSEDTANKEAGEEKPEEDNDYHRSDEQVSLNLQIDRNLCFSFIVPGAS